MYKSKGYRKLGRRADHRKALLRNLTSELIMNGRIETTVDKAKEVRKWAEKTITLAKRNSDRPNRKHYVQGRLQPLYEMVPNKYTEKLEPTGRSVIKVLFEDIVPQMEDRQGGYTRIIKTGTRRGDNAEMAIIELV